MQALDAELTRHPALGSHFITFAVPGQPVDHIEQRKQETAREQHGLEHGLERPQKIDALQKAEEQRRVAERREGAADIGNQKNEEHEDVDIVGAILICSDHRADQHHGCAGRAEKACRDRTDRENRRVRGGRADEIAAHADAAGHHEQGEQQQDERQIIEQDGVEHLGDGGGDAEHRGAGNEQGHRPERCDLAEMMLPEARRDQRQEGDRENESDKGNRPGEACAGTVEMC